MNKIKHYLTDQFFNFPQQFVINCVVPVSLCILAPVTVNAQALSVSVSNELLPELSHIETELPGIRRFEQFESEYGAYDQRLLEPLAELGASLAEQGRFEEAADSYRQALHISRINYGLYHESQIPILDALIESEEVLQNWSAVAAHFGYMEHLYRRLYSPDDPRLEFGLQKVVVWHVNAYNYNLFGERVEHLRAANRLYKQRLQIAEQLLDPDHPKLEFLQKNIVMCQRQLTLASDLTRHRIAQEQSARRDSLFYELD